MAASEAADRRSGAPCSPVRSVSGGSQRANVAPGRGEPSSVTASTGAPTSRVAAAAGSATVADARMNTGSAPYRRQIRRSRRSTCPTWEPNTPR